MAPLNVVNLPLFSEAWQDHYRVVPERGMKGKIKIVDLDLSEETYVESQNDYVTVEHVSYTGKARVQPLRSARNVNGPGNDTTVQDVLFSVPIKSAPANLRPLRFHVYVTEAPLNPDLTRMLFVVHEVVDSTNPLERTFICKVNQEVVVGG